MRHPLSFPTAVVALATMLSTIFLGSGSAEKPPPPAEPQSVLVIPFAVSSIASVKLAAALTAATQALLSTDPSVKSELARAPRVDVLTLIECPEAGDDCIGTLATTLAVDRAIVGELAQDASGGHLAIVVIARGDGSFERLSIPLSGDTVDAQVQGYRHALAPRVGIALPDPPVVEEVVAPVASRPEVDLARPPTVFNEPIDQPTRWSFTKVRPVGWVAGGVGLVAFGTGLGFYAKSKSTERDIENAATLTAENLARLRDLEATGDRQRTIGGTLMFSGGIVAAVGVGLILWDASRPEADSAISGVALAPTGDGAVAVIEGSF